MTKKEAKTALGWVGELPGVGQTLIDAMKEVGRMGDEIESLRKAQDKAIDRAMKIIKKHWSEDQIRAAIKRASGCTCNVKMIGLHSSSCRVLGGDGS